MGKYRIDIEGHESFEVEEGSNLRKAIMDRGIEIHNGPTKYFNCRGMGTCGTCALECVTGEPGDLTLKEKVRLSVPPHSKKNSLRLSCQIKVYSDLKLKKHDGLWGTKKP